jgi:hypothetical protein
MLSGLRAPQPFEEAMTVVGLGLHHLEIWLRLPPSTDGEGTRASPPSRSLSLSYSVEVFEHGALYVIVREVNVDAADHCE